MTEQKPLDTSLLEGQFAPPELKKGATLFAEQIITNPDLLPSFLTASQTAFLEAKSDNNQAAYDRTYLALKAVKEAVDKYDWPSLKDTELSFDDIRSLLSALPPRDNNRQKKAIGMQDLIVESVAKGYVNDRFDDKEKPDWRGAVHNIKRLYGAAAHVESDDDPDLGLLEKCFDVTAGQYAKVNPPFALAWRSLSHSISAVDPQDEEYVGLGLQLFGDVNTILSGLLGREDDFRKNAELHIGLDLQKQIIAEYAIKRRKIGFPFNPKSGVDLKLYKKGINIGLSDGLISKDIPSSIQGYLKTATPQQDLIEMAEQQLAYPERSEALRSETQKGFEEFYSTASDKLSFTDVVLHRDERALGFPGNVRTTNDRTINKLRRFLAPQRKSRFDSSLQARAQELGPKWNQVKFALGSSRVHAFLKNVEGLSEQERIEHAISIFNQHRVAEDIKEIYGDVFNASEAVKFWYPNVEFSITNNEIASVTPLGTLLDLQVEEKEFDKTINRLVENVKRSNELPRRFTRKPTEAGDLYLLGNHEDLPNLIQSAVVSGMREGGIRINLQFIDQRGVFQEGEIAQVQASVEFRSGRVHITFDQELSARHRTLLTEVSLSLFEESCCPRLSEVEEEVNSIPVDAFGNATQSVPGRVVHVGGFRPSGGRKQFTHMAERNFNEVVRDIYGATRGITLAQLNQWHRETDPTDARFLTYSRGYELGDPNEQPKLRSNPTRLVAL